MRRTLATTLIAVVFMSIAGPALAHVTVQPNEAVQGAFSRFVVRVPNERPDASTTKVEVRFPPLVFVNFEDAAGWDRTVTMRQLDDPIVVFGQEYNEVIDTVTWEGGEIEPGEFAEFGFSARMPDEVNTLEFPALQTYDSGEVVEWTGPAEADTPAARLAVLDLGAEDGQGQLALLASLNNRMDQLVASQEAAEPEEHEESQTPLILAWIAIALGVTALGVAALTRRRA